MYFISFHPVDAVKPDDMHPGFTSQLANHLDNAVSQRQHQKELKNINTEQPRCARLKPNVSSDSGPLGIPPGCVQAAGQTQDGPCPRAVFQQTGAKV